MNNGVTADYILCSKLADCSPELNSTSPQTSSAPHTSSASTQACASGTITTSSPQATGSLSPESNNSCACAPASDCASLDPTWTSALVNNLQFNVSCNTHYSGGDIASFMAYQFEDCINACALYNTYITAHPNSECSAVTYVGSNEDPPNCYLKDATAQAVIEMGADSAALLQS